MILAAGESPEGIPQVTVGLNPAEVVKAAILDGVFIEPVQFVSAGLPAIHLRIIIGNTDDEMVASIAAMSSTVPEIVDYRARWKDAGGAE